jgi:hypothetical protein
VDAHRYCRLGASREENPSDARGPRWHRENDQAPPSVHKVLRSPGNQLDAGTQSFMASRFGHDFSSVRVHTDAEAAESARSVGALSYTVGRDVVFGPGQYDPRTRPGRGLLAHELAHVVQHAMQP